MSFDLTPSFQEQMSGPSRPRFTGWLTMAPEVDPPRPAADIPTTVSNDTPSQASGSSDPYASSTSSEQPFASTHGFGYLGQKVQLPQRKKRRATFQVGSPGLSEDEHGGSAGSRSSRGGSESPGFDVRASFAPMPAYSKNRPTTQASTYRGVGDQSSAAFGTQSEMGAADVAMDSSSDDEAGGLSFGGRRWKGKTVHAVEQELEALRDERLMSHAPDAAYLASRLEGVRRNLEIEERRPTYVPYDEDILTDQEEAVLPQDASDVVRQLYPFQHVGEHATGDAATTLPHRPVSNASSVSLVEGETPHDLEFGSSTSSAFDQIRVLDPNEVSMPPVPNLMAPSSTKTIDPAARAAALDARIEVRPLRRGDLEQVRDLHAFHGDSDRSPNHGETYASTASFLLRLLVDDRHVCLVAVARPIPEPAAPLPEIGRITDVPTSLSSGAASPDLTSLHIAGGSDVDSSVSSSPPAVEGFSPKVAPIAPHTRMLSPRGTDGRINNTPATSVFSDIFAERGVPTKKLTLNDLPGPTEERGAAKRVLALPPSRGETEEILGVVSAHLSVVAAADGGFFGKRKEEVEAGAVVDVHVLTLATAPEERGQGLGAKLLASLHGECMFKARLMAQRRGRTVPAVKAISPKFIEEPTPAASHGADARVLQTLTQPTLTDLRQPHLALKGQYLARTWLEVHPSNAHALSLYWAHGFRAPLDDKRAVKRGFYRGDVRIASSERAKRGGTDAWVMERFDGLLDEP